MMPEKRKPLRIRRMKTRRLFRTRLIAARFQLSGNRNKASCDPQEAIGKISMSEYRFYGWEQATASPITDEYAGIQSPRDLYDVLSKVWCRDTCAPRMRDSWDESNKTFGQCSITAFLAQDIFGGEVYGILREGGNYHCFNVVGDSVFDLTSEQFRGEVLDYENAVKQSRDVHFSKEEKKARYEHLRSELKKLCDQDGDTNA